MWTFISGLGSRKRFREDFRFLTGRFYTRCKKENAKLKDSKLITVHCDGPLRRHEGQRNGLKI
jgi:hypothetical protein